MARSYFDRDSSYENPDYERDRYYGRSSRRRFVTADDEPGRGESDYNYWSREPDYSRDYGRRLSTGWDYGTAFGHSKGSRDYNRERDYDRSSLGTGEHDYERRSYSPYRREYGAYDRDYPESSGREQAYGPRFGYRGQGYEFDPDRSRYERARERGWWDRVSDEVASWFGDEEAERRRRRDEASDYRGRGPRNYRRPDDRIEEDINDRLTDHPQLDASEIEVNVSGGEVTLTGTVNSRLAKRLAEGIAESVSGVLDVQNNLRIRRELATSATTPGSETIGTATGTEKARTKSV